MNVKFSFLYIYLLLLASSLLCFINTAQISAPGCDVARVSLLSIRFKTGGNYIYKVPFHEEYGVLSEKLPKNIDTYFSKQLSYNGEFHIITRVIQREQEFFSKEYTYNRSIWYLLF